MLIPIWLLIIVGAIGVISFILSTPYRQGLIDFFWTIGDLLCGALGRLWDFIRGVAPTTGAATATILGRVGMALMLIALAGILFVAFMYFVIGASILTVGIITGHWQAALLFLLALSIWGILSAFPSFSIFRPLVWTSRWIARPVAILFFIYLLVNISIGFWSPGVKDALKERHEDARKVTENSLRKGHAQSERNVGVRGFLKTDASLYDDFNNPMKNGNLKAGTEVMVLDLKGKPTTEKNEAVLPVMLPNEAGDFFKGRTGWIPAIKIGWEKSNVISKVKAAAEVPEIKPEVRPIANGYVPSNAILVGKKLQLCWDKEEGQLGTNPDKRSDCVDVISLKRDGHAIIFRTKTDGDGKEATCSGVEVAKNEFHGTWAHTNNKLRGDWNMKFSPDLTSAEGWSRNQGESDKIPTWISLM